MAELALVAIDVGARENGESAVVSGLAVSGPAEGRGGACARTPSWFRVVGSPAEQHRDQRRGRGDRHHTHVGDSARPVWLSRQQAASDLVSATLRRSRPPKLRIGAGRADRYFFATGTGIPGICTLTEPRWLRLVK